MVDYGFSSREMTHIFKLLAKEEAKTGSLIILEARSTLLNN